MPTGNALLWLIVLAEFGYGALIFGGVSLARRRRKTRWPFKESDKLLRGPGESLRRRILQIDERFIFELLGFVLVAAVLMPVLGLIAKEFGLRGWMALVVVMGGLLVAALISTWRVVGLWQERANYFLGWFGERLTAEKLRPLQLEGYHVFHDVPCEPGAKGFNIDHVVVGPTGVSVVEVKTRRKGNALPGRKDHEVTFDGTRLVWPWGEDRHGIEQALNESEWLRKWLHARTGLSLAVRPVLTLPGWYVREGSSRDLRVVNPSFLPAAIRGHGDVTLTAQQIDLISRQLEERCRDVAE